MIEFSGLTRHKHQVKVEGGHGHDHGYNEKLAKLLRDLVAVNGAEKFRNAAETGGINENAFWRIIRIDGM